MDLFGDRFLLRDLLLQSPAEPVSLAALFAERPSPVVLYILGAGQFLFEFTDPVASALHHAVSLLDRLCDLLEFFAASLQFFPNAVKVFLFKRLLLQDHFDLCVPLGQDLGLDAFLLAELFQLLLQFTDSRIHLFLAFRGGCQSLFRILYGCLQLLLLFLYALLFFGQFFRAACRLFFLLLLAGNVHAHRILPQEGFLLLDAVLLKFGAQIRSLGFNILDRLFMGCRLSLVFFHFLLQFRHFTASSQEIAVIFVGAAADRAAWNEKLTVQSHHADGVPVLFADCGRVAPCGWSARTFC